MQPWQRFAYSLLFSCYHSVFIHSLSTRISLRFIMSVCVSSPLPPGWRQWPPAGRWGRPVGYQSCHPGWAAWSGRHGESLSEWRQLTAGHHLSSSAGPDLEEEREWEVREKLMICLRWPFDSLAGKDDCLSPLVSSSNRTTLLISLSSDSSWIFILQQETHDFSISC